MAAHADTDAPAVHPFSEFGPGPYRLDGIEDVAIRYELNYARESNGLSFTTNLCGGTCDLCGTAIWNVFIFKCANGAKFRVGEICAEKNNRGAMDSDDYAIRAEARRIKREINRAKTARKQRNDKIKIDLADFLIWQNSEKLAGMPHPKFDDSNLLGWIDWMWDHSGVSGKLKTARAVYKALGLKMPRLGSPAFETAVAEREAAIAAHAAEAAEVAA